MRSEYAAKAFDTLDHEKIIKRFRLIWMAPGTYIRMSQTKRQMSASNYVICTPDEPNLGRVRIHNFSR